jgi:hypothetical protein
MRAPIASPSAGMDAPSPGTPLRLTSTGAVPIAVPALYSGQVVTAVTDATSPRLASQDAHQPELREVLRPHREQFMEIVPFAICAQILGRLARGHN